MKKLMIVTAVLAATAQVFAMPTRAELSKAQPLVNELMSTALDEYKSASDKTAAAVKVGDESCAFASEAETEAVKFLLLKGAVNYYVRGEAYDKAADCIDTMQAGISNLTPDAIVEIVGKATSKTSESKAPRLIAYYRAAKLQIRAKKELPVLEQKLKRVKSEQLQRQYAEALAISGNWKAAYDAFAKVLDKNLAQIAKAESKGAAANEQAAELWWNYAPEFDGAGDFFKVHAVEFYQKAIEKGEISGLKKNIVERRIAQLNEEATALAVAHVSKGATAASKWTIPANFKNPLVRTLKLSDDVSMDFCAIPAGTFNMANDGKGEVGVGGCHKVTITRPFWFSKSLVTARQFMEIKPINAEMDANVKEIEKIFPEFYVCHEFLQEDADLYLKGLNKKFAGILPKGYVFRLPTDAEWEYVLYGDYEGDGRKRKVFWDLAKRHNALYDKKNVKWRECRLIPRDQLNKWGVVGWGSSAQMILDKIDVQGKFTKIPYNAEEVDPLREGERYLTRVAYAVHYQHKRQPSCFFRVVIGPDLVSEKMAKAGKK